MAKKGGDPRTRPKTIPGKISPVAFPRGSQMFSSPTGEAPHWPQGFWGWGKFPLMPLTWWGEQPLYDPMIPRIEGEVNGRWRSRSTPFCIAEGRRLRARHTQPVALAVASDFQANIIGCAMRDEASGPDIPAAHPATYGTTAPAQISPWRSFPTATEK